MLPALLVLRWNDYMGGGRPLGPTSWGRGRGDVEESERNFKRNLYFLYFLFMYFLYFKPLHEGEMENPDFY